jgi:RNA methyltransferase, TrmH family
MAGPQPPPRAYARRHRGGPGISRPELTSVRSPRVLAARRLAKRTFRERERRFLVEGPQAVREAVAEPGIVDEIFVTADAAPRHSELVRAAQTAGAAVYLASGEVIRSLADTVTPQGIVAICRYVDVSLATVLAADPRLVAVLAKVRDPGNAGTIIRAADAAGADAIVFTDGSVDPYNPKCVRATAGSMFHLPVVAGITAAEATSALRDAGLRVVAADGHGSQDLDAAHDAGELATPTAWVFGNEAWGLPPDTLALADAVVRIPIYGRAESLNLAAAAAICLYASAGSQRRAELVVRQETRPHQKQ